MIKAAKAEKLPLEGKPYRVWGRATLNLPRFGRNERSRRRLLSSASASALGLTAVCSSILLLLARPAVAQTIPNGQNIAAVVPPPVASGTTLTLGGDASLFDPSLTTTPFAYN